VRGGLNHALPPRIRSPPGHRARSLIQPLYICSRAISPSSWWRAFVLQKRVIVLTSFGPASLVHSTQFCCTALRRTEQKMGRNDGSCGVRTDARHGFSLVFHALVRSRLCRPGGAISGIGSSVHRVGGFGVRAKRRARRGIWPIGSRGSGKVRRVVSRANCRWSLDRARERATSLTPAARAAVT